MVQAGLMFGLLVAMGMGLYQLLTQTSAQSNANRAAAASAAARAAEMNRQSMMRPHQTLTGRDQLSTHIWSCPSEQMNKLSECDADDTPNFGENWAGYVKSQ